MARKIHVTYCFYYFFMLFYNNGHAFLQQMFFINNTKKNAGMFSPRRFHPHRVFPAVGAACLEHACA